MSRHVLIAATLSVFLLVLAMTMLVDAEQDEDIPHNE